jgi:hypothetical protein
MKNSGEAGKRTCSEHMAWQRQIELQNTAVGSAKSLKEKYSVREQSETEREKICHSEILGSHSGDDQRLTIICPMSS